MAIHELYEQEKQPQLPLGDESSSGDLRSFFSTLVTRFAFLLLFVVDIIWLACNTLLLGIFMTLHLLTFFRVSFFKRRLLKCAFNFRRSVVCGLSLLIGLFSPPFGIMVVCTYFLMYDKAGMEEVVPVTLQSQFKDIFKTDS